MTAIFNDFTPEVQKVIDQAIDQGIEVANGMAEDFSHDQIVAGFTVGYVYDQCCVSLALILSADETGDVDYAPQQMRDAMRERLLDRIRFTVDQPAK